MPKCCLDGYLTDACATCPDWADGSDDRGIGCATHMPIMWCDAFAKMFEEENKKIREELEQAREETNNDNQMA